MTTENLSEKVSVNINSSTLSQIDLLVDNGYYSNRSDFINQSLRDALHRQQSTLDRIINQHASPARRDPWFVGVFGLTAAEVEEMSMQGGGFTITGYGVLVIDDTVEEEKLFATVRSIRVKGKVVCNKNVKVRYGLK